MTYFKVGHLWCVTRQKNASKKTPCTWLRHYAKWADPLYPSHHLSSLPEGRFCNSLWEAVAGFPTFNSPESKSCSVSCHIQRQIPLNCARHPTKNRKRTRAPPIGQLKYMGPFVCSLGPLEKCDRGVKVCTDSQQCKTLRSLTNLELVWHMLSICII